MSTETTNKPKRERANGGRPSHKGKVKRNAETLPGALQGVSTQAPPLWGPADLVRMCREETKRNIEMLKRLRDDEDAPYPVRACAVGMLLDRAYGRAPQMIAVADITPDKSIDTSNLSDEELMLLEKLMRKAAGEDRKVINASSEEVVTAVTYAEDEDA